jgi:S1-C subfamily serine protease
MLSDKHWYKARVLALDRTTTSPSHQDRRAKPDSVTSHSHSLMVGQRVYAIGNPSASTPMTRGITPPSAHPRPHGSSIEDAIGPAAVNPGNLIRCSTPRRYRRPDAQRRRDQRNRLHPINTARAILDDYAVSTAISAAPHSTSPCPSCLTLLNRSLPADYGILIERVLPGGAAGKAGLAAGPSATTRATRRHTRRRPIVAMERRRDHQPAGPLCRYERPPRR